MYIFLSFVLGAMGKLYGAATMVGKDERNGRINPALETDDDDIQPVATDKLVGSLGPMGGGGGSRSVAPKPESTQTTLWS